MKKMVKKASKKKVMTASKASMVAKKGKDMGKPGKNFNKISNKAAKEYGNKAAGKKVAGAVFQNMRKSGKL